MTIVELREKRAKLWDTMEGFLDTHRDRKGVLSAEDDAVYANMEKELNDLTNEVRRMERRDAIAAELAKPVSSPITEQPQKATGETKTGRASNAYREDFGLHLRGKRMLHNVLSEGVDANGGYLVPTEFEKFIVDTLKEENVMRRLCKVITTDNERKIPVAATHSTAAWTAENAAYTGGFAVTISVEGGAETAKRTFNPHIGVEGGLSILGTSGIVEPMSQQAILDTIQLEMNQAALRAKNAPGPRRLVLAPGNYGLDYLASALPQFERFPVVKTSNFIGDTLDMAATAKFEELLLVGHVGKLCKLAAGVMNTHSHTADGRAEVFCAHAALCGAAHEVCAALMDAATTDACLDILDGAQLRAPVLESILAAIQMHLDRRAGGAFRVGAVLFSNQHGPLGETKTAKELMQEWQN